ncbi:MAG: flagellar biosynthesis protein FlgB [Gammaproteobacteria bacterium]|nr:flagellar biosynthesis protein FlgB [Gammaproteobacteria bacterium]
MPWEQNPINLRTNTTLTHVKAMPDSSPDYQFPDARILMFTKAPLAGKVKTRLISVLGEQGALNLHLQLMERQLKVLHKSPLCPVQLWLDQEHEHPLFDSFSGDVKLQSGGNLGDKMLHAARTVLKQAGTVIIIGSDCPDLDEEYLHAALMVLQDKHTDLVLGPAEDGGYVLIGMKQAHPEVFQDIDWGTAVVLQQTLARIEGAGLAQQCLSPLRDVDTREDLASLL